MPLLNDYITIESVPGKSYSKVEDHFHIYFIPSELCLNVEDYVHKGTFEGRPVSSLQQWYLSLPMNVRATAIVVLQEKLPELA